VFETLVWVGSPAAGAQWGCQDMWNRHRHSLPWARGRRRRCAAPSPAPFASRQPQPCSTMQSTMTLSPRHRSEDLASLNIVHRGVQAIVQKSCKLDLGFPDVV
jgi:hypothetical protein